MDGVKSLTDIRPVKVKMEANGQVFEENVLLGLVTSTSSVGGFRMPNELQGDLSDGLFEVILVKHIDSVARLRDLADALLQRDFHREGLIFLKTNHVEFTFEQNVDWTLDGEFGGSVKQAVIENYPGAIQIRVPIKKK